MRVALATDGGHPGRRNEDFAGAAPGVVVLVDGAGIPGTAHLCQHGVAWYSHTLGAALLATVTRGADPAEGLADAIEQVASLHRHTCDLADPSSPQGSAAVLRLDGDAADYLVLADAYVVLDGPGGPTVLTDPREVDVRRACTAPLDGLAPGSPEYERALPAVIDALRARRNRPGGYWVVKDDPAVAAEAVTGRLPLEQVSGAAVLSNGAVRSDDWRSVLDLLRSHGPEALIRQVRRSDPDPDDATVAWVDLG